MSRAADLLERAITIYEVDGTRALEGWTGSVSVAPFVEELPCESCDRRQPHVERICVVCWSVGWAMTDRALSDFCGLAADLPKIEAR
jgi:hypothetical protein